jgi:predicted NBD/HSP70 family sugar kinase
MYVLFDIGGTKTRIGVSKTLDTIDDVVSYHTPRSFGEGIAMFATHVQKLAKGTPIHAAAGGIRGPLSKDHGSIMHDDALSEWVHEPIREALSHACAGVPTTLMNDTALVGLGEAHTGAGKGYDIVVYHTISTGVGGVRIVHGSVDVSATGFEPGHQTLDIDMTLQGVGSGADTLEELISGSALEKRYGVKPYEIPQEDPVWDELARYLAFGLKNSIVYWSPDVIVLGGSMVVGNPRIKSGAVLHHLTTIMGGFMPIPPLVDATLGDIGGLHGAIAVLKGVQ